MRELAICLHKAVQGFGPALNYVEAAIKIFVRGHAGDELRPQTARDGLDGRQGIVDLMAEHTDKPPPGLPLLLAQSCAHIGEQQEVVRDAPLAEGAAVHHPARVAAIVFQLHDALVRLIEQTGQPELRGRLTHAFVGQQRKDALRGWIQQAKNSGWVEGEHGRVDRANNATQQG